MRQRIADISETIGRGAILLVTCQVAFLVHTVMGVVVAGLFPALAALYGTLRSWLIEESSREWTIRHIWDVFHGIWRSELKSANLFGWPQFVLWALLFWDGFIVRWGDLGMMGLVITAVMLLLNVVYGMFVLVSWALRANFDERAPWIIRGSMQLIMTRPLCSLLVFVVLVGTACVYDVLPGLGILFGFVMPAFLTMLSVFHTGRLPGMDAREIRERAAAARRDADAAPAMR